MKPLSGRLEDLRKIYERDKRNHQIIEYLIEPVKDIIYNSNPSLSLYQTNAYIELYPESLDQWETIDIFRFSELLDKKWDKEVTESAIHYISEMKFEKFRLSIWVTPAMPNTCRVLKIDTGRTRKTTKYYDVDEPVFDYKVQCSEGE